MHHFEARCLFLTAKVTLRMSHGIIQLRINVTAPAITYTKSYGMQNNGEVISQIPLCNQSKAPKLFEALHCIHTTEEPTLCCVSHQGTMGLFTACVS